MRDLLVVAAAALSWGAVFATGLAGSPWSCLPDPQLGGDFLVLVLAGALFLPPRTPPVALAVAALLLLQGGLLAAFLDTLGGHLLFSDDHSTFFYRLHVLQRQFPDLAAYNVEWNAGRLTTDVFPTGAILLYLIAAPILLFLPLVQAYDAIIGVAVVGVAPWALYGAARLLGQGRRTALVATALGLLPSLLLSRWALKYGAVPFVLTTYLTPLVYALAIRTVRAEAHVWRYAVPLGLCLTLAMFWSGSVFLLAPVGLAALVEKNETSRLAGWGRLVVVAGITLAANLWWIVDYLSRVPALEFVSSGGALGFRPPPQPVLRAGAVLRTLWAVLQETNPVLLAAAPLALADRSRARGAGRFAAVAALLLVVAVVGPFLRRHLEFDRMALPMAVLLTLPAACGLGVLWRVGLGRGLQAPLARGLVVAMLVVNALGARIYLANQSIERFQAMSPAVERLAAAIRSGTRGGRTYIAGFVLHDFSGGHAAGLQVLAGVPMVALDFVHRFWWYQDPLPQPFRRRPDGLRAYLDLLNVDQVVTKDREWRLRVAADPAFELVWSEPPYALFRYREFPASVFLSGEGEVEERPNGLRVRLDGDEAVLRYRWLRGLAVTPPATVEAAEVDGVALLRVRAPRGQWVEVFHP